jgi:hypothetical protein
MEFKKNILPRLPGWAASILMIFFCAFWTYWGTNEMYHEGWWGAWVNRLPYLAPVAVTLIPALAAFRWPIAGGIGIACVGIFAFFFFGGDVAYIGLAIALVGIAFIADGWIRRHSPSKAGVVPLKWWSRSWRYILLCGVPLMVFIGISAFKLPVVLSRVDDGDRGARLIAGNNIALIWAPEGPGWNWKQPWGGYPSWQSLALYGVSPVGLGDKPGYGRQGEGNPKPVYASAADMAATSLCIYLNAGGTTLMDEPQNIWRMPTTDELVRSLGRHGANAGCKWDGEFGRQVACSILPDKESPLWATDVSVIYYYSADSYSEERGYFVAYNGTVNATNKTGGNPRHGYRCVKEP